MKRLTKLIFTFIIIFIGTINVYAKDTVYSVNKYKDENLTIIKDSYNKENKKDGNIVVGTFLKEQIEKEEEKVDNYQIMLIKYKKDGKVDWTYRYGRTSSENIDELVYSYDTNNKIDGYLMIVSNSYDIETETNPRNLFVKIDLEGKLVFEKDIDKKINKLIPTYKIDNIVDGYIGITDTSIIRYDKELNLIYENDTPNIKYLDIVNINKDKESIGYAFIIQEEVDNKPINKLISYDIDLKEFRIINENIELENIKLSNSTNGFIIYGITKEVKLKRSDTSYFISKYNNLGEEVWESIGNIPLSEDSDVVLKTIKDKYFLLYKNVDNSFEVIKLDNEGLVKKKIKKINNSYYNFINFSITDEKELYFVGQIGCPEDEKCNYKNNSLYLSSDEDKVIEVQDDTSTNILVGIMVFLVVLGTAIYVVKSKSIKNKKK